MSYGSPLLEQGYEHLAIFYHPRSSTSKHLQTRIADLQANTHIHGLDITVHEGLADPVDHADLIEEVVAGDPYTIVGSGGGDGTNKRDAKSLMLKGLDNPLAVLGGGSACDLAWSVHDRRALSNLTNMFMRSSLTEIRPLDIKASLNSETYIEDNAFGHFGVGVLAFISDYLNHERVRGHKLKNYHLGHIALEAAVTSAGLLRSQLFEATDNKTGEQSELYELLVSKIGQVGKILRPQISVFEDEYSVVKVNKKTAASVVTAGARLMAKSMPGEPLGDGLDLTINPEHAHKLFMHTDGEQMALAAGSRLLVKPHAETVTYTTTRK